MYIFQKTTLLSDY